MGFKTLKFEKKTHMVIGWKAKKRSFNLGTSQKSLSHTSSKSHATSNKCKLLSRLHSIFVVWYDHEQLHFHCLQRITSKKKQTKTVQYKDINHASPQNQCLRNKGFPGLNSHLHSINPLPSLCHPMLSSTEEKAHAIAIGISLRRSRISYTSLWKIIPVWTITEGGSRQTYLPKRSAFLFETLCKSQFPKSFHLESK